jgi:hypothetical protein
MLGRIEPIVNLAYCQDTSRAEGRPRKNRLGDNGPRSDRHPQLIGG